MSGLITVSPPPSVPTLRYNPSFDDATENAKAIHKAMKIPDAATQNDKSFYRETYKYSRAEEATIFEILTRSTLVQRLQMAKAYEALFEKNLIVQLKSVLTGKVKIAIEALLQRPDIFDAYSMHKALCGPGTNEDTLIEIIFSRSNEELDALDQAYRNVYNKNLEDEIKADTSGPFQKLLLARFSEERQVAYRGFGWPSRGYQVNLASAQADANTLAAAGVKKWITDEAIYIDIFAKRSLAHLKVVFEEYKRFTNKDVEHAIKDELSGDIKAALLAIVDFVNNKNTFFAKRLYESMKGLGTHDKKLARLIVTRCEKDLQSIEEEYLRLYGKTLESWVKDDTTGPFEKILVALVTPKKH